VPAEGKSLADISRGALPGVEVDARNMTNSIQEIFTESRLKPGYVEIRAIDGLKRADRYAAAAFWLGLLYSESARKLAIDRFSGLSPASRREWWITSGRDGLSAKVDGTAILPIARDLVNAAAASLKQRGRGEERYLAPIERNLDERTNPGKRVLDLFMGEWKHDPARLIDHCEIDQAD
jgi:gamma-glutamylcysteine synthetase